MTPEPLAHISVVRAAVLSAPRQSGAPGNGVWRLENLTGRLSELSEERCSGTITFVAAIIAEAQERKESVVWVTATSSIFYPPDFAQRHLDLGGIAVVRGGDSKRALLAAEWLLRSGAFGLLVVDLGPIVQLAESSLGRLLKLAEREQCALLFLTRKRRDQPSLGSMISLRGLVTRSGIQPFVTEVVTLKDKRRSPGAKERSAYFGPPGMY